MRSWLSARADALWLPLVRRAGLEWLAQATYAHRGRHGPGVPENSLPAARAAIAGGWGIECDVQRSHDGAAVVFHDERLERLTAVRGMVIEHRAAWLTQQTLRDAAGVPVDGALVPDLPALLATVAGAVPLLIELKTIDGRRITPLCLAVRRALEGYQGPVAVMSFDPRVGAWFRQHAGHVPRGLVLGTPAPGLAGWLARRRHLLIARPQFLALAADSVPDRLSAAAQARGVPVLTWTVRDAAEATRVRALGCGVIAEAEGLTAA